MAKSQKTTETVANVSGNNTESNLSEQQEAILAAGSEAEVKAPNPVIEAMKEQEKVNAEYMQQHGTATDEAVKLGNQPVSEEQMLKDEILDATAGYKPSHDLLAASADARETLAQISNVTNEIDGTLSSRLTRDLADIGFVLLRDGKLSIGADMDRQLIKKMQEERTLLGNVEVIKDDGKASAITSIVVPKGEGEEIRPTNAIVDTISPYGQDRKTMSNVKPCARKACLVLASHRTKVTWGYIRKSEVSGKRFTRNMVFLPRESVDEANIADYYEVVCVPNNVISPSVSMLVIDDDRHILREVRKSDNTTLRFLANDWADCLFDHYFGKKELAYDTSCHKDKGIPTGMLIKPPMEREVRVPIAFDAAQLATFENFSKAKPEEQKAYYNALLAENRDARKAAIGAPTSETLTENLVTIANMLRDPIMAKEMPSNNIVNALRICKNALHFTVLQRYSHKVPPLDIARALRDISMELDQRVVWDNDVWYWHDESGTRLGILIPDNNKSNAA